MKIFTILFFMVIFSCSLEPPEKNQYLPFLVEKTPEERKYYPEETLLFLFNMEILPETLHHFKAKGVESKIDVETRVENNIIMVIPPLPSDDILEIEIGSGLKSVDYKPLFIDTESPSKTGKIELVYPVGKKIPELVRVIPDTGLSATVAVEFDGDINMDSAQIHPPPDISFDLDNWIVLSYSKPVEKITVKNGVCADRNSVIDDFMIVLSGEKPETAPLEVSYSVTDVSYIVNITGETVLAVDVNGVARMCERRCSVEIEGLEPLTKYDSNITIFTLTGRKTEKNVIETEKERPKIMITEIMHTPMQQPEKSWEFVEIYNYGNLDFDLTDCFIDDNDNNKGIDPLLLRNENDELLLRPGDIAVITGNEAAFGDLIGSALWLVTKDTTVADGGLTSKETVQIKCKRDGVMVTEANEDPKKLSTSRGYSFTVDTDGNFCPSSIEGGTPGRLEKCPEPEDEN